MSVCFDGVGQVCATFLGEGLSEGHVVKLAGGGRVAPCGDGEVFCGVALVCRDDACTAQVRGFLSAAYSGSAPGAGAAILCGNGKGGVRMAGEQENGTRCLVVDTDTSRKRVTILL